MSVEIYSNKRGNWRATELGNFTAGQEWEDLLERGYLEPSSKLRVSSTSIPRRSEGQAGVEDQTADKNDLGERIDKRMIDTSILAHQSKN